MTDERVETVKGCADCLKTRYQIPIIPGKREMVACFSDNPGFPDNRVVTLEPTPVNACDNTPQFTPADPTP